MSNIIDVFGSEPRFQLGDYVFAHDAFESLNEPVSYCNAYGVIIGVEFCKECSMYLGWTYTIEVYKSIYIEGTDKVIRINPNVSATTFHESQLSLRRPRIEISSIVQNLKIRQLEYIKNNSRS